MRISVAVAVACLSTVAISAADDAQAAIRRETTIPAQGLGPALQQLANDRDIQFVYRSEVVGERQTSGAVGELTFDEALTELLKGTGLTYQYLDDRAVTIVPMQSTSDTRSTGPSSSSGVWQRFRLAQAEAPASTSSPRGNDSTTTEALEEVIVTAQKREERLIDVPISLSVLSGDELDRSTAGDVTEALSRVPGVSVATFFLGGHSQVPIRGVSVSQQQNAGAGTTAYYLDSVPFGFVKSAHGPDPDVYDLARVEVLRGPQGTLYGANALNGVVRVLTKDANLDEFEFKARALGSSTEDGGANYRGDVALNVPIVEGKFAARAVVGYQNADGWIDHPHREDANSAERRNVRLKLAAQPTEALSIALSTWSSRDDYDTPSYGFDALHSSTAFDEPVKTEFDAQGLKIGYEFSAFSLTSMTSYLDYSNESSLFLFSVPPDDFFLGSRFSAHTFAEELILSSTGGSTWRWTAGGMYRDSTDKQYQNIPGAIPAPIDVLNTSKSYAVFGELTRIFLDGKFELTGGLRYFNDDVGLEERSRLSGPPVPPDTLITRAKTFDATTPRVVLTWHPDEQLTFYTSYSEGFRSGVHQTPTVILRLPTVPAAEPDSLKNYEAGAKASLFGGRLRFDAAAYYIDWQDVQRQLLVTFPDLPGVALTTVLNGTSASGPGFDLGVSGEPAEGWTLGANGSWNDLTSDAAVVSGGVVLIGKGERLDLSPEYTLGAFTDYEFPLGGGGFRGRLSASANYTSEQLSRGLSGSALVLRRGDSMTIGRADFSIQSPSHWTGTVYVDNVTNENGSPVRFADIPVNPDHDIQVRPRTYGVQLDYRF